MSARGRAGAAGEFPVGQRTAGKKAAILRAAQELFCERGVAATAMDAIAARAHVSKQTVYTYYTTKDGLLQQVLEQFADSGTSLWRAQHHAPVPIAEVAQLRGELRGLLEAIVHTLMNPDYLAVVRVVIAETTRRPELGELFRASIASRILTAASEVVSRVTQLCTGVTVDAGAQLVVGSVLPHVLLEGLLRPDDVRRPDEAQLDRLAGVLASAICAR